MARNSEAEMIRHLRKHPLTVRALQLLLPKEAPLHLQEIAQELGVHKVSAHRTMSGLNDLKLVKVQGGSDGRYRYFAIPESKRREVRQLISATKQASQIPIGRALLSLGSAIQDQVTHALIANGYTAKSASPAASYDVLIQVDDKTVDLDIKLVRGSLSGRKFDEIVGHLLTSSIRISQRPTLLVVVLIGTYDDKQVETSRRLETQLHEGFGLDAKFLWIPLEPLEVDSTSLQKSIIEPISKILDQLRQSAGNEQAA